MAMPPCCVRIRVKLSEEQRTLVRLARLAAYHDQQAHKIENLKTQMRAAKATIAALKKELEDHDAEHAGEVVAS